MMKNNGWTTSNRKFSETGSNRNGQAKGTRMTRKRIAASVLAFGMVAAAFAVSQAAPATDAPPGAKQGYPYAGEHLLTVKGNRGWTVSVSSEFPTPRHLTHSS